MADYNSSYTGVQIDTAVGKALTPDSAPASGSSELITSGGVYDAVQSRVPVYGMGENLLRNWYFVGGGTGYGVFPVNQRGNSSYTTNGYTIDGWAFSASGYTQTLLSSGLQITGNRHQYYLLNQRISDASAGKTVTIAIWSSYGLDKRTLVVADGNGYAIGDHFSVDISINTTSHYIYLGFKSTEPTGTSLNIVFYAAKLELGTQQTLCHNEGTDANPVWVLNEVPDYEQELIKCQTSTADSTDTYANKSLATRQDLTSIQATGTTNTTGAAIPAGAYFYLNGVLHRAKTQIDVNATFTVNTNCEQATVGEDLLKLDNLIAKIPGSGTRDAQLQVGTYNGVATMNFVSLPSRSSGKPDVYVDFAETYIRVYYVKSDGTITTKTYLPS